MTEGQRGEIPEVPKRVSGTIGLCPEPALLLLGCACRQVGVWSSGKELA